MFDPKTGEELVTIPKRINDFAEIQRRQSGQQMCCIFVTSGLLISIGLILTIAVATLYFTDCFGNCNSVV